LFGKIEMSHLLLIEDDEIIGESLQDAFNEYNYQVTWLQRGDIAQEILKMHTFDLVILDFTLPKISGIKLAQFMRGNHDSTPIIMITANNFAEEKQQCHAVGINAIFGKPFAFDELHLCVEKLLLVDR